jgi:hypothetical protein
MDETHILQTNIFFTECNFFVDIININIAEEMTIEINAKLIAIGAISLKSVELSDIFVIAINVLFIFDSKPIFLLILFLICARKKL